MIQLKNNLISHEQAPQSPTRLLLNTLAQGWTRQRYYLKRNVHCITCKTTTLIEWCKAQLLQVNKASVCSVCV